MTRAKVILADDHGVVVDGLMRLLDPEFEVVGTASDGRELLVKAKTLRPDVIVADVSMPLLNGLDALEQLKTAGCTAKVVFLTAYPDPAIATQAFRLGAVGYVLKHSCGEELLTAVREALQGRTYITPRIADQVLHILMSGEVPGSGVELTAREREVLQLLAEGKTMKEIAGILNVSPRTVEFHRHNLSEKTGLTTIAELARFAAQHGLVGNPN